MRIYIRSMPMKKLMCIFSRSGGGRVKISQLYWNNEKQIQGAMTGPHWSSRSSSVSVVVKGRGRVEIVIAVAEAAGESGRDVKAYRRVEGEVSAGDVFIVPACRPAAELSYSDEGFDGPFFLPATTLSLPATALSLRECSSNYAVPVLWCTAVLRCTIKCSAVSFLHNQLFCGFLLGSNYRQRSISQSIPLFKLTEDCSAVSCLHNQLFCGFLLGSNYRQRSFLPGMNTCYLRSLYECCEEIQQQELTLQDMQTRILRQQSMPLYRLGPTIKLLKKIRQLLKMTIHIHERDAHRQMRHQLQEQLAQYGTTINTHWCCRCHGPSCIYD